MMPSTTQVHMRMAVLAILLFSLVAAIGAQAQSAAHFLGSITSISGNTLTVKTDSGEVHPVAVPDGISLKRVEPGQKDLSTAATIPFSDLAVGDRVLVLLAPNSTSTPPEAARIIAIKQADVSQKQQQEREDWQKRGIAGLVKSVDTSSGVITITTGAGPTAKVVTVKTAKNTILKRYAPGSVRFDQAQPAPIDTIHAGDQLRARGDKNADGTDVAAEEVVSGSFRNLSGLISTVDATSSTVSIKDLATKKQVTIHLSPDTQMHRIPDQMAQALAARLNGTGQHGSGQNAGGPSASGRANGDPQQIFSRMPVIQITDLQKGQAIMVVATDGASDVQAIMLLSGVEPLLQAPAASNLLSNWSMGGGGEGGAQ